MTLSLTTILVAIAIMANLLVLSRLVWVFVVPSRSAYTADTYDNNNPLALKELVKEVEAAHTSITMAGGNACHPVYASKEFTDALRKAYKRSPGLTVTAAFPSPNDCPLNESPLADAAREFDFALYELDSEPTVHFRVVDAGQPHALVYFEEPHEPDETQRRIRTVRNATVSATELSHRFSRLCRDGRLVSRTLA